MFLQQARLGKNEWWRYIVTILVVFVGYGVGQIPLSIVAAKVLFSKDLPEGTLEEFMETQDFGLLNIDQNLTFFLILLSFVGALAALWLMVKYVHEKPFKILITPFAKINWQKIGFSFGLWFGLTLVGEAIFYFINPANYEFQFSLATFVPLFFIAIFLIPLQTSFEELLMRGYLMQGISLISAFRWIPLVVTSVLFGLMHSANPEIGEFGFMPMMTYYIGVGLFLGVITLMDDSLELALGVHAATNLYGSLLVTFQGSALQTPTVFRVLEIDISYMNLLFFAMVILFLIIAARKYNWTDWSKIYGRMEWQEEEVAEEDKELETEEPIP